MINDLKEFIAIKSVLGEPAEGAPFGKENSEALRLFLDKAESYGLKVGNDDGYAGWAEYGEGEKMVGILAHLDVVPAGNGWSTDPFTLTIENGKLYGRGVSDDKGPMIACLHALKRLAEERANLGARVRLIVGCNEENGSSCIEHYVRNQELPTVSFTPDSDFPVVASEKGIVHVLFTLPISQKLDGITLSGGCRPNVVPDYAELNIGEDSELYQKLTTTYPIISDLLRSEKVAIKLAENGCDFADYSFTLAKGLSVSTIGAAAHGSTPEKGDNALRKVLSLLSALTNDAGAEMASRLASPDAVKLFGIEAEDVTGKLTLNLGICNIENGVISLTIDLRLPATVNYAEVIEKISARFSKGVKVQVLHNSSPLAFDENDELVQALLGVYRKCTGDYESHPLHIGGGTYAKELPNCIGFGAVFPSVDTRMHDADECYPVQDFYKLEEIYYRAIKELCKLVK
ncbi:MAG: Sapep family Mn(2+)-dependent dipeptidase [Clostridia bacterium]|nr:Sapep family Mn(2+)-dependent dipeptidase [Clostridia bacterium]